jgi:hypothetical protein
MANEKKSGLPEEYLRKFKHRSGYVISESPKYRPLVTDNEEFDEIPMLTNEVGDQEDAEKQGQVRPAPSNDQPQNADAPETPVPAFDAETGGVPPEGEMTDPMGEPTAGEDPLVGGPQAADAGMGMPPPESPENEVDDLQNEIIKHNIEAMRGIHDQLANLDSTLQGLNQKMEVLSADVEEVREPTDSEKLMNKTSVSYPYYFNLNDFWKDNWFDQKRAQNNGIDGGDAEQQGMKELPDGTYVADFDDLPQKSKIDVQNSFNDMV